MRITFSPPAVSNPVARMSCQVRLRVRASSLGDRVRSTSTFLKEFSLSVKFFWVVFELRAYR